MPIEEIKEQIYAKLRSYGIAERIVIDDDVADAILQALTSDDIALVMIDDEGGLVVEFNDNENI